MKIDVQGVLADAWRLWRRDRSALIPIAGIFFFLPQFALRLFVLEPEPPKPAATESLNDAVIAMQQFYLDHALPLIGSELCALAGALTLFAFYLRRGTTDVGGALSAMVRMAPGYVLLSIMVNVAVGLGLALLILPGYYLLGRLILAGPIYAAEQPIGAFGAIEESWGRTRKRGFLLAGLGVFATIIGYLIGIPVEGMGELLDRAPLANPVSGALIEALGSMIVAASLLATVLIRVALYRRMLS